MFKKIQSAVCTIIPAFACAGAMFAAGGNALGGKKFDSLALAQTDIEFDRAIMSAEDGKQHLLGNVVVSVGGLDVRTEELIYDVNSRVVVMPGSAAVNFDILRFITRTASFDGEAQTLAAADVRGSASLAFISGGALAASQERFFVEDAVLYFAEPHWSSLAFHADELEYIAGTDKVRVKESVVRIGGVPVLAFPSFVAPRIDRPPVRVWANSGSSSAPGYFFRTTTHLMLWDTIEPGLLLDEYERSGLLIGPAATYNFGKKNGDANWAFGDLQTAYINDTANRSRDIYKNYIGGPRGFVEWTHKQKIDRLEISSSVHYRSDSEVMRNFRPDIYDDNQNPDNYVEAVLPDNDFYVSVFTRFRPNEYQNVQQRLPEIRFDLQPREIFETGVFQHFNASFAMLKEKDSDQYKIAQVNCGDDELESSRADFYYGLTSPLKFGDIASFTPVLGARLTHYGETVPKERDSYTRVLGQIGFDLQFLATGTTEFENKTWNIDGLRHVFRPVFKYRYIPGTASQSSRIPEIDRETYLAGPAIMDVSENRAVDQIYDEHAFRFGVENLFQTRDSKYGSRDLVELNIYQDVRKSERPHDDRAFSHNFIELTVKPAPWVNFFMNHRMDVYNFETKAISSGLRFTDGDLWKISLTATYLNDEMRKFYGYRAEERQYVVSGSYAISSYHTVFAEWRFNDLTNTLTEQNYGLRQRLGNSWEIEYYIKYRRDAGDDSDFSGGVAMRFVTF